jgi:type VI secretion system secreted protein Hcp
MANSMFIKIPGMEGEATDSGFEGQIALLSYTLGMANMIDRGMATGAVQFEDISISKYVDKASPSIYKATCLGNKLSEDVVLTGVRAAGDNSTEYMQITLKEATFTRASLSASEGGGLPSESITIHFENIAINYKTEDNDQTEFTWNLVANTP